VASETAGAGESRRYHASARRDRGPGPLRPRRADVADIYDQGASAYEALWSPVILPPAAVLVRSLGLRGRCVIADIGAGTGALLGHIGSAAPAARVVALDASTRMLRIARTRRGASAVLADALALPLADGTADAVILAYVLFHLADPARAAAEAARVLRPGGRAGIITWAWERQPRASTVWDQVLAEAAGEEERVHRAERGLGRRESFPLRQRLGPDVGEGGVAGGGQRDAVRDLGLAHPEQPAGRRRQGESEVRGDVEPARHDVGVVGEP